MTAIKAGDVVGECANPKCGGSVVYSGGNEAVCQKCGATYNVDFEEGETPDEAPAAQEAPVAPETPAPEPLPVAPTTPPPAPVQPEARPIAEPAPVQPLVGDEDTVFATADLTSSAPPPGIEGPATAEPVNVVVDGDKIGNLTEAIAINPAARKKQLQLDPEQVNVDLTSAQLDLPEYVRKSRPWKWGQVMSNTGNPYRQNSKSWQIFNLFHEHERTVEQAILDYAGDGYDVSKMSYLLTVYEVVTQCVAAGLLLIDPETRIIGVCKDLPQARQLP